MSEKRQQEFQNLMTRLSSHLTPEQAQKINEVFTASPNAALALAEETMAKADYTRNIQEVQQQRLQLQQEQARVTELAEKVSQYDNYIQSNSIPRDQYESLMAERNAFASQIEQIKSTYPDMEWDVETPSKPNGGTMTNQQLQNQTPGVTNPPANPIKPVSELQFNQQIQQVVAMTALTPAAINDLSVKHQQLFGTHLPNATELVNRALAEGKDINQIWSEEYKVPERMAQLEEERFNITVQAKVDEELAKRISQGIIAGNNTIGHDYQSPFLQQRMLPPDQRTGVNGAPDPNRIANQGTGVGTAATNAAAAYLSGKYKGEKFSLLSN